MNQKQSSTAMITKPTSEWDVVQRQAKAFLQSGYLREEFTKGVDARTAIAKVATVITMGDELGIGRMQALRSINVIKGKPSLAAELMLGLALHRIPGFKATFKTPIDKQHLECTVLMQRQGGDENEFRFTMDDAKNAGLVTAGSAWVKYPRAMLRARAISEGLRAVAPDATMGLYATEELSSDIVEVEAAQATIKQNDAAEVKASQEITGTEKLVEPAKPDPAKKQTGNTVGYDSRHEAKMKEKATDKQVETIRSIASKQGISEEELCGFAWDWYGKDKLEDLTKGEIQGFFDELNSGSGTEA